MRLNFLYGHSKASKCARLHNTYIFCTWQRARADKLNLTFYQNWLFYIYFSSYSFSLHRFELFCVTRWLVLTFAFTFCTFSSHTCIRIRSHAHTHTSNVFYFVGVRIYSRYAMERYKQALEIFLKIDKTAPNGDHEVCYYIGMSRWLFNLLNLLKYI